MLIATAGHVDHGKTTLIKTLTGTDTDKLKEEKSRGLSIDLGFAYLNTPDGQSIGFVDVPGHERFIRNMAAGVAAIDVAMLLVAADDGVMPQTREHVAILGLYGVRSVIPVISRTDLVEESSTLESISGELLALLDQHGIATLQEQRISCVTGDGVEALKDQLFDLASRQKQERSAEMTENFRMAVDRSFSIEGAGTVVTGTVYSGQYRSDDDLIHLPSLTRTRVKKIVVNGQGNSKPSQDNVAQADRSDRVSLNITGLSTDQVSRGDWICSDGQTGLSQCLDVEINLLAEEPRSLGHWSTVHVHCAAANTTGQVSFYDARKLEPGDRCFAQLVLPKPVHAVHGDRIVLRDATASRTIGGAYIIDPASRRYRGFRKNRPALLQHLLLDDHGEALRGALAFSVNGLNGVTFRLARNLKEDQFKPLLAAADAVYLDDSGTTSQHDHRLLFASGILQTHCQVVLARVQAYHDMNPELAGIPQRDLLSDFVRSQAADVELPKLNQSTALRVVEDLISKGTLIRAGSAISRAEFVPELSDELSGFLEKIKDQIGPDITKPPSLSAVMDAVELSKEDLESRIGPLVKAGHLVRVSKNRVYHPVAIKQLAELARELYDETAPEGFDAKTFRNRSGIGRNITIEVLEYLDEAGFTRRLGNLRIWRS